VTSGVNGGSVWDILADENFASLVRRDYRHYLSWDELTSSPLPQGMSAKETWDLLFALRRISAVWFPLENPEGVRYGYFLAQDVVNHLRTIEQYCRSHSSLHQAIQEREGRRFLTRSRIQEAIAAIELDGVAIEHRDAGRLLHAGRTPRCADEQLVLNSHELLVELEGLASGPFSPELFTHLYERLTAEVDTGQLVRGTVPHRFFPYPAVSESIGGDPSESLQAICDYANGKTGDPEEPPVIAALAVGEALAFWRPLPDFNNAIAWIAFRLYALKHDYPVLGYLPLLNAGLRWERGELPPGTVRFDFVEDHPFERFPKEADWTPRILTNLELAVAALQTLLGYVEVSDSRDSEIAAFDPSLNHRQLSVVARALRRADAEFRVSYHRVTHNVAYATARADLLDLVEKGYLVKELRGQEFVFTPDPRLGHRMEGVAADKVAHD
jgi:Fic family protein